MHSNVWYGTINLKLCSTNNLCDLFTVIMLNVCMIVFSVISISDGGDIMWPWLHDSSIIRNDIACHTLRAVSITTHLPTNRCSNLCSIGRVQVISNTELPVAIEGNCSCNCTGEAITDNSLTDVSMKCCCPNFIRVDRIKMVIWGCPGPPVAIERDCSYHLSGVNETLCAFRYVAMMASLTRGCCANFENVRSV